MTDRTRTLTLVGAVLAIVVVVGIVLAFGLRPYPDLPTVAEQPDPPVSGTLAHTEYHRDGPCVVVVEGDGSRQELGCGREFEGQIHWIAEDRLGVRTLAARDDQGVVDVVDTDTGEVVDQLEVRDRPPPAMARTNDDGDRVSIGGTSGTAAVLVSSGGTRETVLQLDGPEDYGLIDVGWTADGRWIAAQDTIGRVIAVDPTGGVGPRIWAEDVGAAVIQ